MVAIAVFLYYYARQNFRFGRKKSSQATYVTNCFQHAVSACKGVGSSLKRPSVSTISNEVSQKGQRDTSVGNVEITPPGLVYTTNPDCITRSNTISSKYKLGGTGANADINPNVQSSKHERRLSIKNVKNLMFNDSNTNEPKSNKNQSDTSKELAPKSERRLSLKNIKNLKLNTTIKYNRSRDTDTKTPDTTETDCGDPPQLSVKDLMQKFNGNSKK